MLLPLLLLPADDRCDCKCTIATEINKHDAAHHYCNSPLHLQLRIDYKYPLLLLIKTTTITLCLHKHHTSRACQIKGRAVNAKRLESAAPYLQGGRAC